MQRSILMSVVLLLVISCNNSNNNNNHPVDSTDQGQTVKDTSVPVKSDTLAASQTTKDTGTTKKYFPKSKNIDMVMDKMNSHAVLDDVDYNIIYQYALYNKDESTSEGVGGSLFDYFKGNQPANEAYYSFLNKKGSAYREKILPKLIELMCIDIADQSYTTYEKLVSDFSLFKESKAAEKELKTCNANALPSN